MELTIGQKVRIRKDLKTGKHGTNSVIIEMLKYRGKIATIKNYVCGEFELEEFRWFWTKEMFEDNVDKILEVW